MSIEDEIRNKIKEVVAKDTELTEKEREAEALALEKMFIEGELPQKALGFSDSMVNFIYGQAYRLYDTGNFKKASIYFYFLNDLNPTDPRFMTGFAACKMKLEEYEEAIVAYITVSLLDPQNPFPRYYLGNLYRKIGKYNASYVSYKVAAALCGDNPELAKLKERANLNIKALETEGVLAA